jgi:hypothetical protein
VERVGKRLVQSEGLSGTPVGTAGNTGHTAGYIIGSIVSWFN